MESDKIYLIKLLHTANILTALITAFGSFTFPTVIMLCMLLPKTVTDCVSLAVLITAKLQREMKHSK